MSADELSIWAEDWPAERHDPTRCAIWLSVDSTDVCDCGAEPDLRNPVLPMPVAGERLDAGTPIELTCDSEEAS